MTNLCLLPLLSGILLVNCGGVEECAQAFDKELECGERSNDQKKEMKSKRAKGLSNCKKQKAGAQMQSLIRCSKEKSCEDFQSCKFAAKSEVSLKTIERDLADGDTRLAMGTCLRQLGTYRAVPAFEAKCEEAITQAFSNLDSKENLSDAQFRCEANDEWREYSPAFVKGCLSLASM